jgi:hypothetical protein
VPHVSSPIAQDATQKKLKLDPAQVDIGASSGKVSISETAEEFSFNQVVLQKSELAAALNCQPEDRCWAVAVSSLGWPLALRMCNHAGEKGHESHNSSAHCLSTEDRQIAQTLYQAAARLQGKK